MAKRKDFETDLERFELYDPDVGGLLRRSAHIRMLGLGRSQLNSWEASTLSYFYGSPQTIPAFNFFVMELRLPEKLQAALLKSTSSQFGQTYWGGYGQMYERLADLELTGQELNLHCGDQRGYYQLQFTAPPLPEAQREAALEWLRQETTLTTLARGEPFPQSDLKALNLIPAWDELTVIAPPKKAQAALALGVKFLCRAFVAYPAYLLIWRGLGGEAVIRQFVEAQLVQRQKDFQVIAEQLPADPQAFWATPELPALPMELRAGLKNAPEARLVKHLPTPTLWPKEEENVVFIEVLTKIYKNIPKKILRLIMTER
jgi:hypothetical protein